MRRVLRVGVIAICLAILPSFFVMWQNSLMREQLIETRNQNLELVRSQRKADISRMLGEVEGEMARFLDLPFQEDGGTLGRVMAEEEFLHDCTREDTRAFSAVNRMMNTVYPYVRLLSELYLLDTRVLDPLSDRLSEEHVSERGAATSAEVYWLSNKMVDVMGVLEECRPGQTAVFRLVKWNSQIDDNEYSRYMIPATDIKYKYDVAKTRIAISEDIVVEDVPKVRVELNNRATRSFERVVVRCLIGKNGRDLASASTSIDNFPSGGGHSLMVPFPELVAENLDEATVQCNIDSATSTDPAVTALRQ